MMWTILLITILLADCYRDAECRAPKPKPKPYSLKREEVQCPTGKEKWMQIKQIPWGVKNRAALTVPPGLKLTRSTIPGAGRGIIATTFIPRYTWLGEYEGEIVKNKALISPYAWTSKRRGKIEYFIDAYNKRTSNWPRWVNCARHIKEENVDAVLCRGKEFYLAKMDIYPGQELLTFYGEAYAKRHLGVDVKNYYNIDLDIEQYKKYSCWNIPKTTASRLKN